MVSAPTPANEEKAEPTPRRGGCPQPPATTEAPRDGPMRTSIPTPFVPSGHFPLIGGIGPYDRVRWSLVGAAISRPPLVRRVSRADGIRPYSPALGSLVVMGAVPVKNFWKALHFGGGLCYNSSSQRNLPIGSKPTHKGKPPERCDSPGVLCAYLPLRPPSSHLQM